MTPVTPTTTGNVFQISWSRFIAGLVPTNELSRDHPFIAFWVDFRTKILTRKNCQPLLEAYVLVFLGNEKWMDGLSHLELASRIEQVVNIIRDHPPDVLILDQPANAGYCGLHLPDHWPYICVSKFWVDQWTLAMAFDPKRRLTLALESVLRGTLVHEVAHWLFSLVKKISFKDWSILTKYSVWDSIQITLWTHLTYRIWAPRTLKMERRNLCGLNGVNGQWMVAKLGISRNGLRVEE